MSSFPPVAELLPHSAPMILLDELIGYEGAKAVGKVTIREGSMFVSEGQVPALVAIEYMAQAIGLQAGIEARRQGKPIRVGYLLGTRELSLSVDSFKVGDELIVEAERLFGEEQLGSFRCAVTRGGEQVASATVSVYQNNELEGKK